ncbi:hypothetical protein HHL25_09970 [Rhizobium sp. S-51]|uniref:Uncharacterized protein n=1 Tax=Rhizobium terricola TaxID=2728849 RepID=A0A7Y0AVV2_9HYPH|nr:hypothetical protein [Rhizobium terricola]NML74448.1 hypothetical protein [Rhizobium terricola]
MFLFLLVPGIIPHFAQREQELPFKHGKMKSKYLSPRGQWREFVPVASRGGRPVAAGKLEYLERYHSISTKSIDLILRLRIRLSDPPQGLKKMPISVIPTERGDLPA